MMDSKFNKIQELEREVADKLNDSCWEGLQELYKEIDRLTHMVENLMEINEAHHKFNGELQAKVDKLVADKICLLNKLKKIEEFNSYDECGVFKEE